MTASDVVRLEFGATKVRVRNATHHVDFNLKPLPFPPTWLRRMQEGRLSVAEQETISAAVTDWLLDGAESDRAKTVASYLKDDAQIELAYADDSDANILSMPLEMTKVVTDRLAMYGPTRGIVHEVEPLVEPQGLTLDWPLKILLFRAAPPGYEPVPSLTPLVTALRQDLGDAVLIDALSSESGGDVSFKGLTSRIKATRPHVVVFLGHGLVAGNRSYLAFESQGAVQNVASHDLREMLQNSAIPLPLLILLGCLTAAPPPAAAAAAAAAPQADQLEVSTAGLLGFAQDLIRSSLGVWSAIGTRMRIFGTEPETFLGAFFRALVNGNDQRRHVGDVGAALKAARLALKAEEPGTSALYAPMLIQARTSNGSPFSYLQRERPVTTRDEAALERRRALWTFMSQAQEQGFALDMHEAMLEPYEAQALGGRVVLQATRQLADRGESVKVPITLSAPQRVRMLRFSVPIPGDATLLRCTRAATLDPAFGLFKRDEMPGTLDLVLAADREVELPAGPLVEVELELPPLRGLHREVSVNFMSSDPPRQIVGEVNVVLFKAPAAPVDASPP